MNKSVPLLQERAQRMRSARSNKALLDAIAYLLLILGALVMVRPFIWMIATALKLPADQFSRSLIPSPATLANFQRLWDQLPFTRLIINSLSIATLSTIGQMLTCAMAAFCFAVVDFPFRRGLFVCLLATLMLPPQI